MHREQVLVLFAAWLLACSHPAPPPLPPPVPVAAAAVPPPQPKCEAVSEACIADDDTHARIESAGWTLKPPRGWRFAQESNALVTETTSAGMAVTSERVSKTDESALSLALARAADRLGVRATKKSPLAIARTPTQVIEVGPLHVSLLVLDHAVRSEDPSRAKTDRKGAALVFWTRAGDVVLVGVGFADDDDKADADKAIFVAVSTLAHVAGP